MTAVLWWLAGFVVLGVLIAADLVKDESGLPRHGADILAAGIATEDNPDGR